jgi:hypothetical protein
MNSTTIKPASAKQLRYLRTLAERTGTTFTTPGSSSEASREINRLRRLPSNREIRDRRPAPVYATAPVDAEITGYGVRAHWRHTSPAKQDGVEPGRYAKPQRRTVKGKVIAEHTEDGTRRQLLTIPVGEHRLLIDRALKGGDARLLARLAPDEPPENEQLIARMYLADPGRAGCRAPTRGDLDPDAADTREPPAAEVRWQAPLVAAVGATFQIHRLDSSGFPALRWTETPSGASNAPRTVSLREVVGRLEDYQPAVAMTQAATDANKQDRTVSVATLTSELQRLMESKIVLNRRLRERVQSAIEGDQATMSQIAVRCGRFRTNGRGRQTGETSWVARRIGVLPEAGAPRPTPWVHTEVLAVIARDGLGITPVDAELT